MKRRKTAWPGPVDGSVGRLQGLPPIVGPGTRLLILGSFPGAASLQLRQYYAHPQNHFWKILQALWPAHPLPERYELRCAWLLARGLGVWDVYASCEREGSLDSAIRNAEVNDFAALKAQCPKLQLIVHNGGESYKHAKLVRASLGAEHFSLVKLPSTSPANASWSFDRKCMIWREPIQALGLTGPAPPFDQAACRSTSFSNSAIGKGWEK